MTYNSKIKVKGQMVQTGEPGQTDRHTHTNGRMLPGTLSPGFPVSNKAIIIYRFQDFLLTCSTGHAKVISQCQTFRDTFSMGFLVYYFGKRTDVHSVSKETHKFIGFPAIQGMSRV